MRSRELPGGNQISCCKMTCICYSLQILSQNLPQSLGVFRASLIYLAGAPLFGCCLSTTDPCEALVLCFESSFIRPRLFLFRPKSLHLVSNLQVFSKLRTKEYADQHGNIALYVGSRSDGDGGLGKITECATPFMFDPFLISTKYPRPRRVTCSMRQVTVF